MIENYSFRDLYNDFHRFEHWFLNIGTRPTVTIFMIVFILLGIIAFFHPLPWPKSHKAWFFFSWMNAIVWAYFRWSNSITSEELKTHVLFFIAIFGALSGLVLVGLLIGKYGFGTEDKNAHRY